MAIKANQPVQPPVQSPCFVKDQPSGGLSVTFQIDKITADRIKRKAGTMDISRFIYENIIKGAVSGAVY